MKNFNEWLAERHPEALNEGWMQDIAKSKGVRNFVAGAALAAGGLGMSGANAGDVPQRPAATAQDSQSVTAEAEYNFDDNESIRDAVEEATLEAKAKIAKMYGSGTLSGVGRPAVKIDRKNQKVFVTITASKRTGSVPAAATTPRNTPSSQKRVSKTAF